MREITLPMGIRESRRAARIGLAFFSGFAIGAAAMKLVLVKCFVQSIFATESISLSK